MRFRVSFLLAAGAAALISSSATADDIGAAARGVVRVIVAAQDSSEEEGDASVSFGSGFAISPHHIVTNAHVVEDAWNPLGETVVAVVPAEGNRALKGQIIAYDRRRDLAVVDVGTARLEPLAIYSGPVNPGDHGAALGYPGNVDMATAGSMYDLIKPTVPVRSEGNISNERSIEGHPALLHTAAIARGNSGGPLVDGCGRVLGVNTYSTSSESGDANFGFAIISQELMSFLRENNESFQQVGTACVSAAEQAQRERDAADAAARAAAAANSKDSLAQQRAADAAREAAQDSRQNHVAFAALLGALALIGAGLAAMLFVKERVKVAAYAGGAAAAALIGAGIAFWTRPSLNVEVAPAALPAEAAAAAPLSGKLLCQVKPELSRVTVSATDDLAMVWSSGGCMNGRTQYVADGDKWRRVLVPNGSETVAVQDFDPAKGELVSRRYLLPQPEMERLRAIRGETAGAACSSDPHAAEQLQAVTDQLVSALPPMPNEKLVYHCGPAPPGM
jgi:S1-C subfamily serine protease